MSVIAAVARNGSDSSGLRCGDSLTKTVKLTSLQAFEGGGGGADRHYLPYRSPTRSRSTHNRNSVLEYRDFPKSFTNATGLKKCRLK